MEASKVVFYPNIYGVICRTLYRKFTLFLLAAALAASAVGEERICSVRIETNAPNVPYRVDGQAFFAAATFLWPVGSKHVLSTDLVQTGVNLGTRYRFRSWSAGTTQLAQPSPIVTVTADPAIPYFRLDFDVEYLLTLSFFNCGDGDCSASTGTVYVNQVAYRGNAQVWESANAAVSLEAMPNPGYVFLGWQQGNNNLIKGFLNTVTMNGPMTVYPRFEVARRIRLETVPSGLQLLADRAPVTTPTTLEWGWNTTHSLGPVSPQSDNTGRSWVFRGWTDGAPALRAFQVPAGGMDTTLTAEFTPAARFTFLTSPPGLKLRIDGRDNWYGAYSFSWGTGETHHAEAPAEQTGADGRKWVFRGWSNGGSAAQDVTVADGDIASGVRLIATYEALGRLTVQSAVAGLAVTVDGAPCRTPCVLDRPAGSEVQLAAPASVAAGDGTRYDFQGWGDATAPDRAVTFTSDAATLTAGYRLVHRLVMVSEPAGGALFHCDPESTDGFYDAAAQVAVRLDARPGFRFRRFEGDLTGSFTSGVVGMSAPRYVRAVLERVPYIAPAGVRNGAGETPVAAVAPGSVITILGANLAPDTATGPESPLVQTLAGVTVRLGDRMLPLFYVSPEQINAQLPSDVEPGDQSLAVWGDGRAEVRTDFTVARNAPGLFQAMADGEAYSVAAHQDGTAVTAASPARRGETITLYGTGWGPCDRRPPDGFALPASPAFTLADPVEVVAGDAVLQPVWAGAAPGRVGVEALRLKIGAELPPGPARLKVRVNGQESNTVLLPVE